MSKSLITSKIYYFHVSAAILIPSVSSELTIVTSGTDCYFHKLPSSYTPATAAVTGYRIAIKTSGKIVITHYNKDYTVSTNSSDLTKVTYQFKVAAPVTVDDELARFISDEDPIVLKDANGANLYPKTTAGLVDGLQESIKSAFKENKIDLNAATSEIATAPISLTNNSAYPALLINANGAPKNEGYVMPISGYDSYKHISSIRLGASSGQYFQATKLTGIQLLTRNCTLSALSNLGTVSAITNTGGTSTTSTTKGGVITSFANNAYATITTFNNNTNGIITTFNNYSSRIGAFNNSGSIANVKNTNSMTFTGNKTSSAVITINEGNRGVVKIQDDAGYPQYYALDTSFTAGIGSSYSGYATTGVYFANDTTSFKHVHYNSAIQRATLYFRAGTGSTLVCRTHAKSGSSSTYSNSTSYISTSYSTSNNQSCEINATYSNTLTVIQNVTSTASTLYVATDTSGSNVLSYQLPANSIALVHAHFSVYDIEYCIAVVGDTGLSGTTTA